jgi:hypothetical protein
LFISAYDFPFKKITNKAPRTARAINNKKKHEKKGQVFSFLFFIKNYGGETGKTPYAFAHGRAIPMVGLVGVGEGTWVWGSGMQRKVVPLRAPIWGKPGNCRA